MKKFYILFILFSSSILFGQSNYLVENFNYDADAFLSANGWNIHSATTNDIKTTATGLTFAGYVGSNIGRAAAVNNTGIDVNKVFEAGVSTGSVYTSFMVKAGVAPYTDSAGFFFHYGLSTAPPALSTSFRARTFIVPGTDTATQIKFGLSYSSSSVVAAETTADYDINGTYVIVIKYTFNTDSTTDDTVSMFIFSASDALPATEPATPTLGPYSGTGGDLASINAIALRQYSANQNIIVDGFYVRTVWNLTNAGVPLSAEGFTKEQVAVYPNPATQGQINFNIEGQKNIKIYDVNGRTVLNQTISSNNLDISSINKGFYLVTITAENTSYTTKLIVN